MPVDNAQILTASIARLSELIRERRQLDKEIRRIQSQITRGQWTGPLDSADPSALNQETSVPGFTDAIRQVLSTYRIWLSPTWVRDLLPLIGFKTSDYREPLSSIHVILRRLTRTGEVSCIRDPHLGAIYRWAGDAHAHDATSAVVLEGRSASPTPIL